MCVCVCVCVCVRERERMTNKMHILFPLFVSTILSSTCFEQTSSKSGGYLCTHSIREFPCMYAISGR